MEFAVSFRSINDNSYRIGSHYRQFVIYTVCMDHVCDSTCTCKMDMAVAAMALEEASKRLSASIFSDSDDLIDSYYAFFRLAKAKFCGARAAYQDHLKELS
jgi:hypothetical protein